jgi:hypothetical protein
MHESIIKISCVLDGEEYVWPIPPGGLSTPILPANSNDTLTSLQNICYAISAYS